MSLGFLTRLLVFVFLRAVDVLLPVAADAEALLVTMTCGALAAATADPVVDSSLIAVPSSAASSLDPFKGGPSPSGCIAASLTTSTAAGFSSGDDSLEEGPDIGYNSAYSTGKMDSSTWVMDEGPWKYNGDDYSTSASSFRSQL